MATIGSVRLLDDLGGKLTSSVSIPMNASKVYFSQDSGTYIYMSLTEAGVGIQEQRFALGNVADVPYLFEFPASFGQTTLFFTPADGATPDSRLYYMII